MGRPRGGRAQPERSWEARSGLLRSFLTFARREMEAMEGWSRGEAAPQTDVLLAALGVLGDETRTDVGTHVGAVLSGGDIVGQGRDGRRPWDCGCEMQELGAPPTVFVPTAGGMESPPSTARRAAGEAVWGNGGHWCWMCGIGKCPLKGQVDTGASLRRRATSSRGFSLGGVGEGVIRCISGPGVSQEDSGEVRGQRPGSRPLCSMLGERRRPLGRSRQRQARV